MDSNLGTWNQTQFAARNARQQPPGGTFELAPKTLQQAINAEATGSWGQMLQAAQQRDRIRLAIQPPTNTPVGNTDYDPSEEDLANIDAYNDAWTVSQNEIRDNVDNDDYDPVRALSRIKEATRNLADQQTSSAIESAGKEIYGAAPGVIGDSDTPCEDGGFALLLASVTSAYQLLITFWDEVGDNMDSSGLGKALPPRFNKKTIVGWGMIVNAVFVLLWSLVGLALIMLVPIIIASVIGTTGAAILYTFYHIASAL